MSKVQSPLIGGRAVEDWAGCGSVSAVASSTTSPSCGTRSGSIALPANARSWPRLRAANWLAVSDPYQRPSSLPTLAQNNAS